ncbi:unnamed protein product [Cuscuta epithymum]|uniref:Uncharacterized protein n=1 Tax=Cuscuta epithymum TaxID=186058 RepID=A0AAV0DYU7_9ASTE|nr:unnamed protein product [Cuscuta epithymum]
MENGGFNRGKINAEDVITKIKEDGDFDRLRLKVVRKVKDDEELHNNIMSAVRQSKALNHPSAKRLKPRQLSDAIYEEVGTKVMSEISDNIWKVIRSVDGIKNEIAETVQSVCKRLLNPNAHQEGQTSSNENFEADAKGLGSNSGTCAVNGTLSDNVPNKPHDEKVRDESNLEAHCSGRPVGLNKENGASAPSPGFPEAVDTNHPSDRIDEDPDVPPGFG